MKKSREVAFLGIISALSVVILFLGAILEVLDMTAAVFAALMLLIAWQELRYKAALVYFVTAIISFFFAPFSILRVCSSATKTKPAPTFCTSENEKEVRENV